ncbi:hypothetical protein SAMN05421785_101685 [Chryseobacterium gambrini]|uniref:DUF6265 domain-containing protein n=1 Tax=Chryseobacterium gambrini TaxID=373672 RepID=A0A1N7KRG9_9FLAO|nr:DUF6265 family protein [Chryseobacterium gambrini]SIS64212.1 hypothetical protein SAMN05421785_101685 [Chryseobacterium gambrini]
MKTEAKFFITVVSLAILYAWTIKHKNDIQKAEWLIGTWENKTQKGSIYETWTKAGNNEFSGKSYSVKDKDTIVFENVRLVQEKNRLYYIPTVKNQNEGLPVRFAARAISENQLVFENPQQDVLANFANRYCKAIIRNKTITPSANGTIASII